MSAETEKARLSQQETLDCLLRPIGPAEMVTVCHSSRKDDEHCGIYCALIPSEKIEQALSRPEWDLRRGSGTPSSIEEYGGGARNGKYLRFGNEDGIEPLVIDRAFYGLKESYLEISEEFRLFHNLYHDRKQDIYIKFDDSGNEEVVAIVKPKSAEIRMKEIHQFLAVKEMHLSIQFDITVSSSKTLEEMGLTAGGRDVRDELACWNLSYRGDFGFYVDPSNSSSSNLQGIRLIEPRPKAKSEFERFAEAPTEQYADFIIGMDDNGDDIVHTCNPDKLSNFFGANPEAPNYITSVSFRKQVLDKYYQEPSKYKIEDGTLRCGSLWDMRIDNHHNDKVCAMLGDLGLLPQQEQLHWKSHNIASTSGYSEVTFRRDFGVEWVESDRPEHVFQERYRDLAEVCRANIGWQIFLPLASSDEYHIQSLRVPATDEQRDFDGLVLGLATILVDSLNVGGLKLLLPHSPKNGSINLLATVLANYDAEGGSSKHIEFLRNLQSLRSSGSAHRKGERYDSVIEKIGASSQDLRTLFADILWQAVDLLEYLIELVKSQRIRQSF